MNQDSIEEYLSSIEDIIGGIWVDHEVLRIPTVGAVRGMDTAGGGDCSMHAIFGVP